MVACDGGPCTCSRSFRRRQCQALAVRRESAVRPQSGLSRLIVGIQDRTFAETAGRPSLPRRIFEFQNRQKPLRCQPITVAGFLIVALGFRSGPQESISGRKLRPLHRALQNTRLVTEGHNFKLKRRSPAKESPKAAVSATNGGEQGNRKEEGQPLFISSFEACENDNRS